MVEDVEVVFTEVDVLEEMVMLFSLRNLASFLHSLVSWPGM